MIEEIGRIVVKTRGREAGLKCVIVDTAGDGVVILTGPKKLTGVRRRRANLMHIAFTPRKVEIKRNATDEEVLAAIEKAGLLDYMRKRIEVKRWQFI
ncbi:MAG: 50S ribosomal protein L14e [Nitrososphaerota archaeon]